MPTQLAQFIVRHMPLTPVPTMPEIKLYTATRSTGLSRMAGFGNSDGAPYWAFHWAGGLALARHILSNPECVRGKSVLDFGTGSGLVAIAAAKAGARLVIAVDVDPQAVVAAALNATANDVGVEARLIGKGEKTPEYVQVTLAGDVFYNAKAARDALSFFNKCRDENCEVLVGDPGRKHLPTSRMRQVAEYLVPDMGERSDQAIRASAVYLFADSNAPVQS